MTHRPDVGRWWLPAPPLGWIPTIGLLLTIGPLLAWAVHSMTLLTQACGVEDLRWACVPAVATNGVMILSTAFASKDQLDPSSRTYAKRLAGIGAAGDVFATALQHALAVLAGGRALEIDPHWTVGAFIGGLPSAMGLAAIHLTARVIAHNRRVTAAADAARLDADRAQHTAAVAVAEREAQRQIGEVNARLAEAEARKEEARTEADRLETERTKAAAAAAKLAAREQRSELPRATRSTTGRSAGQAAVRTRPEPTGPDVSDLVDDARKVADRLAKAGQDLTRTALVSGLRSAGRSVSTDRANALLRVLRSDTNGPGTVSALRAVAR